jgi:hypothetical protein
MNPTSKRIPWLFAVGVFLLAAPAARADLSPFDAGSAAQFFIDRTIVHDAHGVCFTLHPARKYPANPILKADRPWEGWRLEIYGSVLYDEDEKLFKMWYLCEPGPKNVYFDHDNVTCYATSKDGVRWDKPLVGTLKAKNGKPHNAVAAVELAGVIKDQRDHDPARRYKMIAFQVKPYGYCTLVSPDGLNWKPESKTPIAPEGDVITGYWDEGRGLYVAFPKLGHTVAGLTRRCFWTITSRDFKTWTRPRLAFAPDARDDAGSLRRVEAVRPLLDVPDNLKLMRTEFYGIGAYPAESCTVAFPWMLTINNNARFGNHEGPGELQLAASRDLVTWERPFRTPCVPRGKSGEWDCGFFTTASRAVRVGDEIRLYYGGSNYTHGTPCLYRAERTGRLTKFTGSLGLATWKLDRFVSVDGPAAGGTLTTVPLRFKGQRLEINAATKPSGQVVVELLDAAGRPLKGFEPSAPFCGDELRHTVRFARGADVAALAGKPVTLRFRLKDAQLFTFAFRE